jgi:hypothetical protein
MVVSPLTLKKNWTKAEIIRLFNYSANARRTGWAYPETSLSGKSLQRVVTDIAGIIDESSLTRRSTRPRLQAGLAASRWRPSGGG